jgi:hypothetical protein
VSLSWSRQSTKQRVNVRQAFPYEHQEQRFRRFCAHSRSRQNGDAQRDNATRTLRKLKSKNSSPIARVNFVRHSAFAIQRCQKIPYKPTITHDQKLRSHRAE